ncbi:MULTISPECIES: phage major capsid protein [Cytobacillus]|uniref:phage major capsid protein n=1 Tax=Cytobacillus TaxID=2675230 RepID=UPI00203AB480|nr:MULTISPECIES: phage major capsid protein [Cytobacillus]MCM3394863.1 phage major capsid protein [Cytobacillus oceanisediminis]UQX56057.1 phage major capsid protein [Cytobacillus pseudoceanisediminis]
MTYLKEQLSGFVPTEQAAGIMKDVTQGSTILKLSKVEPMKSEKKKFSVLAEGPGAYWVGEAERIQTSEAKWIYPEIEAKKLAVIIPVTKEKLNDTTIDVFSELTPEIAKAFYTAIDGACLFGTNTPFAKSIFGVSDAAGSKVELGTNTSLDLDVSDVMALVEDSGLDVNGFVAHRGMKNSLRKLRDANGNALYVEGVNQKELYNQAIEYSGNGSFDKTKAELIAGNFDYSIVGIRQGIEYQILTEATLQNTLHTDGKPLSLAEQDMVAIKATMRIGFLPVKENAFALLTPKQTA